MAGLVIFPGLIVWHMIEFWYAFFLVHIVLTIIIWAVSILGLVYTVFLIIIFLKHVEIKPFKIRKIANAFRVPAVLLLIGGFTPVAIFAIPTAGQIDTCPHLSYTGDPATSMTVTWYSVNSYAGEVNYGLSPSNLNLSMIESTAKNEHVLNLTGLSPDTRYYYQVDGFNDIWSFKTANNTLNTTSFIAFSDLHNLVYKNMFTDIALEDPDFLLVPGDLVDMGGWKYMWDEFFDDLAPLATNYSMMTAIGNHDMMIDRTRHNYKNYLSMPGEELYYHFKYNEINFICLDLEWGKETYSKQQQNWLENLLDTISKDEWIVVYDHCMIFSSGGYGNATGDITDLYHTLGNLIDTFHPLFVEHDVDLVISGHDHHFEVSNVDDVVYTIVGTGSTRLDPPHTNNNTDSIYFEAGMSGFTKISINGGTCTVEGNLYQDDVLQGPFTYSFSE